MSHEFFLEFTCQCLLFGTLTPQIWDWPYSIVGPVALVITGQHPPHATVAHFIPFIYFPTRFIVNGKPHAANFDLCFLPVSLSGHAPRPD